MQERIVGIGHDRLPADLVGPAWLAGAEARIFQRGRPVTPLDPGPMRQRNPHQRRDLDLDRALLNPAAAFETPDQVVSHPLLSSECKREILQRWAWDECLVEIAQGEGMLDGPPSRLAEVKSALLRLGDDWSPKPAAPAAYAPRWETDDWDIAA